MKEWGLPTRKDTHEICPNGDDDLLIRAHLSFHSSYEAEWVIFQGNISPGRKFYFIFGGNMKSILLKVMLINYNILKFSKL